jgi:hypothetical protein
MNYYGVTDCFSHVGRAAQVRRRRDGDRLARLPDAAYFGQIAHAEVSRMILPFCALEHSLARGLGGGSGRLCSTCAGTCQAARSGETRWSAVPFSTSSRGCGAQMPAVRVRGIRGMCVPATA